MYLLSNVIHWRQQPQGPDGPRAVPLGHESGGLGQFTKGEHKFKEHKKGPTANALDKKNSKTSIVRKWENCRFECWQKYIYIHVLIAFVLSM